ncbi:hypothetical protein EBR96_00505 [bacterium]|nr:hypothetical protein [bacterium]
MKHRSLKFSLAFFLVVLGIPVFADSPNDVLVRIGSKTITRKALEERLRTYPPEYADSFRQSGAREKVLDEMIDEELLLQVAQREGVERSDDFKRQLERAKRDLLLATVIRQNTGAPVTVSESEMRQYYQENPALFKPGEQRLVAHILVRYEQEARQIQRLLNNGADFDKLAKDKSIDPNFSTNGGRLGWVSKGQLDPELDVAAYGTDKGAVSIAKSRLGYHVVKVLDVQVRPGISFSQVQAQIRDTLIAKKKQTLLNDYLNGLKKNSRIIKEVNQI